MATSASKGEKKAKANMVEHNVSTTRATVMGFG